MNYKTMMDIETEEARWQAEEMILGMADIVYENRRLRRELERQKNMKRSIMIC